MMNTTTPQVTPDLSQRPARATLDKETVVRSRQSPWEPGASAGASKVLIGLAGAAIVGGIALAVVTMGPAPGAKKTNADRVAAAQVARDPAAQMNSEPPAAGTAAATTEPPAADTTAKSAETPAATAQPTPAPQATTAPPATAPADTTTPSTSSTATVPPPIVTPQPSPAQPSPDRAPGSTTPTPGE